MVERFTELEQLRSLALSESRRYHASSSQNARLKVEDRTKWVVDSMPMYTLSFAARIAECHMDLARTATMSSINYKIQQLEDNSVEAIISFAKTQKKDALYDIITVLLGIIFA